MWLLVGLCWLWLLNPCAGAEGVHLITFLDCSADMTGERLEELEQCDVLALVATEVAREVINSDPNKRSVTFYPVEIRSTVSSEVS